MAPNPGPQGPLPRVGLGTTGLEGQTFNRLVNNSVPAQYRTIGSRLVGYLSQDKIVQGGNQTN